jgi:hypothetical protein
MKYYLLSKDKDGEGLWELWHAVILGATNLFEPQLMATQPTADRQNNWQMVARRL